MLTLKSERVIIDETFLLKWGDGKSFTEMAFTWQGNFGVMNSK